MNNQIFLRYDIMTRCWNLSPEFRPRFEILRQRMDEYLRNEVCCYDITRAITLFFFRSDKAFLYFSCSYLLFIKFKESLAAILNLKPF